MKKTALIVGVILVFFLATSVSYAQSRHGSGSGGSHGSSYSHGSRPGGGGHGGYHGGHGGYYGGHGGYYGHRGHGYWRGGWGWGWGGGVYVGPGAYWPYYSYPAYYDYPVACETRCYKSVVPNYQSCVKNVNGEETCADQVVRTCRRYCY